MAEWTFDGGGIRFGDGGPGLGGFLPDAAQVVVTAHNIALDGLQQQLAECQAALASLQQVLTEIAKDNPPDSWQPYDSLGDYRGYYDGTVLVDIPDESNAGDVHDHGETVGAWGAAKIARRGLASELGRDRLALEQDTAQRLASTGVLYIHHDCQCPGCCSDKLLLARLRQAGLLPEAT